MSSASTDPEDGPSTTLTTLPGFREVAPSGGDVRARATFEAIRQRLFPEVASERQRVGRFVLDKRLGTGGMGLVFAAWDPQLDRKVALKILKAPQAGTRASARLLREARALAKLRHPHVVAVHEVGVHDDEVFIAMDFIDGCTLRQWLESPRSWRQVVDLFIAAGRGLAAAHEAGLVHRDFKPDNVLIDSDGNPYVADFGVARSLEGEGEPTRTCSGIDDVSSVTSAASEEPPLTQAGALVGTPAYMAPEQLEGRTADARSDQFSYCATLYEALFGVRPFPADSFATLIQAMERSELVEPGQHRSVPRWLRRVVARGLKARPEERFGSLHELLDALETGRRRRVRWIAFGAAGAGAVAATAITVALTAPERTGIECDVGHEQMDPLWNAPREAALQDVFERSAASFAEHAWARAHDRLSAYADAWVAMRREACEATYVRGTQSTATLEARVLCLDRRLAEFAALLEIFETADEMVMQRAARATEGLTPVSACADVEALARISATSPLPDDPRMRARVQHLRERLARLRSIQNVGRFEAGLKDARVLLDEATALGYQPSIADANYRVGSFLAQTGEPRTAETYLETAFMMALAGGDDVMAANASSTAAHVVGIILRRHEEGERWFRIARSLSERIGHPTRLVARTAQQAGNSALLQGDLATAREALEQAMAAFRELDQEGDLAETMANLAVLERRAGNHEVALRRFEEAEVVMRAFYGPGHPRFVSVWNNRAAVYIALERWDDAQAELTRALELMKRSTNPTHPSLGHPVNNLGEVFAARGDHEQALRQFNEALEIWQTALGSEHPLVAHVLTKRSLSLTALGRQAEAFEDARRAFEWHEHDESSDADMAHARLALALALPPEQRRRAREQMVLARAAFEAGGHRRELAQADAWLASSDPAR